MMTPRRSTAFVPVNDLETLLVAAVADSAKRAAFQRAVLTYELLAVGPEVARKSRLKLGKPGKDLALMEMMGPEGRPVAALFTAQPRIEEVFGLGRTAIAFRGDVILTIVARRGAFLNPGLPYAVYWSPRTIDRMLNGPGSATSA